MALIIEDGSGVTSANSYGTIAGARSYAADRGITLLTDDVVSAQLVLACDYLQNFDYVGDTIEDLQSLSWPRKNVRFASGDAFPDDTIPANLILAQYQLVIEQFNGVVLQPSIDYPGQGGFVTEEKVDVLMTKFSERIGTSTEPLLPKVDALLRGLIQPIPTLRTVRV